ncbi:MAG: SGNH/GDSL hydrolase family protein [Myxococcota bacterium]
MVRRSIRALLVSLFFTIVCAMSAASTANALTNGETISDSIPSPGVQNGYTFFANAGEGFLIAVQETAATGLLARLFVFDPNGVQLTPSNRDSWADQAAVTGTYSVVVYDLAGSNTGAYALSFALAPGANEGGSLGDESTLADALTPGDIDSYTFSLEAGDSFAVATQETGGTNFNTRLSVYDPSGARLSVDNRDSWFELAATTGTYTVFVYDFDLEDAGSYDLSFARLPGAGSGGVLGNGDAVAGSVVAGGIAAYTFGANAGEVVSVAVGSSSGTNFAARLAVYDPEGTRLTPDNRISYADVAALDGTYTVLVFDFDLEDPGSFVLSFSLTNEVLSYAALGDSYSSGEGIWPYFDPTDTWRTGRHQSTRAWSTKLRVPGTSQPIAARSDAEFDFLACTGAETVNVQAGGEDCGGHPTQLTPANHVDASRDLVTLSIGGNDSKFPQIAQFCMAHNACNELHPFDPHSNVELGELMYAAAIHMGTLQLATFQEIRAATPNAPTIVFGYPILMAGVECPAASVPFAEDAKFSAAEQAWMREYNAFVNDVTAQAAALAGVHFVAVADRFAGHEVCGPLDDWINGLMPLDPYASFHPRLPGVQAYVDAGNAYLESLRTGWAPGYFSTGLPRNPAPTVLFPEIDLGGSVPANAPAFGELFVAIASAPVGCEAARNLLVPDQDARVTGSGFAPSESVSIRLVIDDQSSLLATVTADPSGGLDAVVAIPSGIASDLVAYLEASGAGSGGGGLLLIAQAVTVTSVALDGDGDGIPDGCDNCPSLANADQLDQDLDGEGDVCDACPAEFDNDADGDGLCAGVDVCPNDPLNDVDADGVCGEVDNCAIDANPSQADADGDGTGDACAARLCHATQLGVSGLGDGDVSGTPLNCGFGSGYFDETSVELLATPAQGLSFTGWTGAFSSIGTANPLVLTAMSGEAITAQFCATTADADGDLVADTCDNCPATPDPDQSDPDGDGQGNPCDPDDDGDGLLDVFELAHGFDSQTPGEELLDPDFDGLDNLGEQAAGTDPHDADSDDDGFTDGVEVALGSDPLDAESVPASEVPASNAWGRALLLLAAIGGCWAASARVLARSHARDATG